MGVCLSFLRLSQRRKLPLMSPLGTDLHCGTFPYVFLIIHLVLDLPHGAEQVQGNNIVKSLVVEVLHQGWELCYTTWRRHTVHHEPGMQPDQEINKSRSYLALGLYRFHRLAALQRICGHVLMT